MNEIFQTSIIGAIQGITEFLPISSSAHLVLTPYIFNWDYKGLGFDVALHFGTVLAILFFFWEDWKIIIKSGLGIKKNAQYPSNLLWQIVVASIPAGVVGYLIQDYVESKLHSPLLLAFNLALFGVILYLVDKKAIAKVKIKDANYLRSITVGFAQSLALIPGVSRSGITMLASRALGLNRESAARFSFILGTPAMIGAFLFEAKDLNANNLNVPFITGVVFSSIFGFLAIKYLLQYLRRGSFAVFMWYRIIIAILIAYLYFVRG